MKCYNHHDRDAFGTAFLSGKGLCLECLEEYKGVLIENGDKQAKMVIDKMLAQYKLVNSKNAKIAAIIYILGGLAFAFIALNALI